MIEAIAVQGWKSQTAAIQNAARWIVNFASWLDTFLEVGNDGGDWLGGSEDVSWDY